MRRRTTAYATLLALTLAGCGGGRSPARQDTTFDEASAKVVHASAKRGGTLRLLMTDAPVSLDPGNIGYAYGADLARLYARSLVTYAPAPGQEGLRVVPDLAEGLGKASDGGRTWTYRLRAGAAYENGDPVRARDVKYAVARSGYTAQLTDGPRDLREALTGTYWGPYLDKDLDHFTGVTAPDDRTVVFHLKKPSGDFDRLAASPQTAPVPAAKDTRLDYERHPLSTGPYEFEHHTVGKDLTLVRNPHWKDDRVRAALPDRIEVTERIPAADVDTRLLDGTADADLTGAGVQQAARDRILASATLKARADDPLTGLVRYAMLPTGVKPFDDVHCRLAVQYAADHKAVQDAYGGPAGGDVATTVLPPTLKGDRRSGAYVRDLARARTELRACGHPGGFATVLAVRADHPEDIAAARALTRSLAQVGIAVTVRELSAYKWGNTAGSPSYVRDHGLGLVIDAQATDQPTAYGFLKPITGAAVKVNDRNVMQLHDADVDSILRRGLTATDPARRADLWADADRKVMASGAFLPLVDERTVVYRPPTLTNVYVHPAYGTYDLASLGRR